MKKLPPTNIICRTMYCPQCHSKGNPHKGDKFVVWGSTEQNFHARICHHDVGKLIGFTPHLITFLDPVNIIGGKVDISVSCGVCETSYYHKDGYVYFVFKNVRYIQLEHNDFQALLDKWTNTGFELI